MHGIIVEGVHPIISVFVLDGVTFLTGDCADWDAYSKLPAALTYEGLECGLSGWNSDHNRCYWRSDHKSYAAKTNEQRLAKLLALAQKLNAESHSPYCAGCGLAKARERWDKHKKDCLLYPS